MDGHLEGAQIQNCTKFWPGASSSRYALTRVQSLRLPWNNGHSRSFQPTCIILSLLLWLCLARKATASLRSFAFLSEQRGSSMSSHDACRFTLHLNRCHDWIGAACDPPFHSDSTARFLISLKPRRPRGTSSNSTPKARRKDERSKLKATSRRNATEGKGWRPSEHSGRRRRRQQWVCESVVRWAKNLCARVAHACMHACTYV